MLPSTVECGKHSPLYELYRRWIQSRPEETAPDRRTVAVRIRKNVWDGLEGKAF